jgi:hypothetical protein
VFVRVLFIASIFAGGTGILLYILLWILVPKATSASQRLEMRGSAVTVDSVSAVIKERVDDIPKDSSLRRILYFPFAVASAILRSLGKLGPAAGVIVGLILTVGSFLAILGASIAGAVAGTNLNAPYFEFPLRDAVPHPVLYGLLLAGYVVVVIPLAFIFLLGFRLLRTRFRLSTSVGFGMLGAWFLAVILAGVLLVHTIGDYERYMRTSPAYQEVTQVISTEAFNGIRADDGIDVTIASADAEDVAVTGWQKDNSRITAHVEDGILVLELKQGPSDCFFCVSRTPHVVIHAPALATIEIDGGRVTLDNFAADALAVTAHGGSLTGKITTQSLTLTGTNTYFDLAGAASSMTALLSESVLSATELTVTNATITAERNSSADVHVTGILNEHTDRRSQITHLGTPQKIEDDTEGEATP